MFPAPGATSAPGPTPAAAAEPQPVITEEEKALATQAQAEFDKGNMDACIGQLNKLLKTRPQDPKVVLNKEVALYCKSGLRKTDEFIQSLIKVCEMVGRLVKCKI